MNCTKFTSQAAAMYKGEPAVRPNEPPPKGRNIFVNFLTTFYPREVPCRGVRGWSTPALWTGSRSRSWPEQVLWKITCSECTSL